MKKQAGISKSLPSCPKCGSKHFRISSFRSNDPLLFILFYKLYRCQECRFRFKQLNSVRVTRMIAAVLLLLLLVTTFILKGSSLSGGKQNHEAVNFEQTKQQALKGDAKAELKLGLIYHEGNGVIKSPKEATEWFKKASEHGNMEAAYHYGTALLKGTGILQNYKEAIFWLEKSARSGYKQAQYDLGNIYRYKTGVEADPKRSYLWFSLAAAQGSVAAAAARDSMESHLKIDEITALQEEARKIKSEASKNSSSK